MHVDLSALARVVLRVCTRWIREPLIAEDTVKSLVVELRLDEVLRDRAGTLGDLVGCDGAFRLVRDVGELGKAGIGVSEVGVECVAQLA
jgi:hypothetical protein